MISGIYSITHRASGRIYVGSAQNVAKRWRDHLSLLKRGIHENKYLQRSWSKYGADAFDFALVEEVADLEQLLEREQHWIDALNACKRSKGFNICPIAGSCRGRKLSAAHIEKMRLARTGCKHSDEAKAAIAERLQGNRNAAGYANYSKLNAEIVLAIFELSASGAKTAAIALEIGVSSATITRVLSRTIWCDVPIPQYILDAVAGRAMRATGESSGKAVLTAEKVRIIKQRLAAGDSGAAISRSFSVDPGTVSSIKSGRTWVHITL